MLLGKCLIHNKKKKVVIRGRLGGRVFIFLFQPPSEKVLELFSLYSIIKRNKNTQLVIYKIIMHHHCPPDNCVYFFEAYISSQSLEFIDPIQGAITLFWNYHISSLHFIT